MQNVQMQATYTPSKALALNPTLYPWDIGATVAEMQELLRAQGFKLRIDGDFGWQTEVAVKRFQKQNGLRIDGVVGPETWAILRSTVQPGRRILRKGHSGSDVYELQGLLQVQGYEVPRDGLFGEATKHAVIQFQQEHHLNGNGIVGSTVWTLLQDIS